MNAPTIRKTGNGYLVENNGETVHLYPVANRASDRLVDVWASVMTETVHIASKFATCFAGEDIRAEMPEVLNRLHRAGLIGFTMDGGAE